MKTTLPIEDTVLVNRARNGRLPGLDWLEDFVSIMSPIAWDVGNRNEKIANLPRPDVASYVDAIF